MKTPASLRDLPPPPPETLKQKTTYWQYRTVWGAVAALPAPVARKLPATLGPVWKTAASQRQRDQVERNLRRIVGDVPDTELDQLVTDAYVSYARYWLDAFRLHRMDADDVTARTADDGLGVIDRALEDGGAILATGHIGSWDLGAMFSARRDWRMTVVAEVLEPRRLFERFVWLRERAGIDVIPLVRGGDMIDRLVEVVDDGGLATLLADRDLTKKGPIVEFFGEPCRLPPGTAVLARKTGRPVMIGAFVTDGDDGFRGVVQEPVDISGLSVEDGTQVVAHELETLIGRYPAQWHVFVPNWLADREPDHPAVSGR